MNPAFKVLIVYESFAWGIRAKEMLARLVSRTHPGSAVECDAWNFELLAHAHFRNQAAGRASAADMVILSARSPSQLPSHVKHWIQGWLPHKKAQAAALVAMFGDPAQASPPPLHTHLSQMAQMGGRDFFWQSERHPPVHTSIADPDPAPAFLFDGNPDDVSSSHHWGINE